MDIRKIIQEELKIVFDDTKEVSRIAFRAKSHEIKSIMKKKYIVNKISKTLKEDIIGKEPEGASYKTTLNDISNNSKKIESIIDSQKDLPAWIQDKITIASHNMDSILGYLESEGLDEESKGLWANIHAKKKRGEAPAKKGDKDYPDKKSWDKASKSESISEEEYDEACSMMERISFMSEGEKCGFKEIESPGLNESTLEEAEYRGRKVKLGKIMQGDVKKFKVYVKNDKKNVVKVNFGQKGVKIKKNNPKRRKSFRARHNCDNPGPRWKPRYWSCKKW
jgi:hypothetical protein